MPGGLVRDCTFRWCGADVGMGGPVSGFERHTADRLKRPELHVDHCTFDCSNSFLFDGNDNPTKNIPFANHQIWENSYFLAEMAGLPGPVVGRALLQQRRAELHLHRPRRRGRGDLRGADRAEQHLRRREGVRRHVPRLRQGPRAQQRHLPRRRLWFHSEAERSNAASWHGAPCYGATFPMTERGQVPWLSLGDPAGEGGIGLGVRWLPLADHPEIYYCENWDVGSPLLIDGKGFASYRAAGGRGGDDPRHVFSRRACPAAVHPPDRRQPAAVDGRCRPRRSPRPTPSAATWSTRSPWCGRAGSRCPYRALSKTEFELLQPPPAGQSVEISYYDARGRQVERFPITAAMLAVGPAAAAAGGQAGRRAALHRPGRRAAAAGPRDRLRRRRAALRGRAAARAARSSPRPPWACSSTCSAANSPR